MAERPTPAWHVSEWLVFTGLSQADLVRATGWSKGRISDIIAGKERFNADHIFAFAAAIGCTPGELLDVNPLDKAQFAYRTAWRDVPHEKRASAMDMLRGLAPRAA